ncbi:type II secretion system protein GspG [Haloferula sp. BvORR071]|uniref:type II secretion system protein GspG n=1 Tax=Haloferula sp. BvORR071 TaxID=1396141 RepID=UPI000696B225|nr:type II secretion system protein GspG [Haloferula sp. BvORR071]
MPELLGHSLLAGLLAWSTVAHAHIVRVEADFNSLGAAIKTYRITTGTFPPPEQGLQALITRPASLPEGAPWVQVLRKIPLDPWDHPYHYVMGEGFEDGFGLYSCGKDGRTSSAGNDPDDHNTWDQKSFDDPDPEAGQRLKLIAGSAAAACMAFYLGRLSARRLPHKAVGAGGGT